MLIAYLDQNKWIELAKGLSNAAPNNTQPIYRLIVEAVDQGQLLLPLSFTNLYETMKVNIPERRVALASLQAKLSRGIVLRSRSGRRKREIMSALGAPVLTAGELPWFLSSLFFEASIELDQLSIAGRPSDALVAAIRGNPAPFLFDYLIGHDDNVRQMAVRRFTKGIEVLRTRIEMRRAKHASESLAMRRRIYSALIMIDHVDLILETGRSIGQKWNVVSDIGSSLARRLMVDVPSFYIERELAIRLETQSRPLEANDFRDMQAFCVAFPYVDVIIAENLFTNLARQAGLDRKYGVRTETKLERLLHGQ